MSTYLSNLLASGDDTLVLLEDLKDLLNSLLGASTKVHGVAASSNVLDTFSVDGASENSGGGGTVTSGVVGLGSDVLDETTIRSLVRCRFKILCDAPSTEVLYGVLEGDGLCDGNTVFGDLGSTEALACGVYQLLWRSIRYNVVTVSRTDDDGPSLGAESSANGFSEDIDTLQHALPSIVTEHNIFGSVASAGNGRC